MRMLCTYGPQLLYARCRAKCVSVRVSPGSKLRYRYVYKPPISESIDRNIQSTPPHMNRLDTIDQERLGMNDAVDANSLFAWPTRTTDGENRGSAHYHAFQFGLDFGTALRTNQVLRDCYLQGVMNKRNRSFAGVDRVMNPSWRFDARIYIESSGSDPNTTAIELTTADNGDCCYEAFWLSWLMTPHASASELSTRICSATAMREAACDSLMQHKELILSLDPEILTMRLDASIVDDTIRFEIKVDGEKRWLSFDDYVNHQRVPCRFGDKLEHQGV